MRYRKLGLLLGLALVAVAVVGTASAARSTQAAKPDISTLAGKVAAVNGTAGLQIRFSAFIEQEAADSSASPASSPIAPVNVLSSLLDGTAVAAPNVTVNQDTAGAPQNETAIAVDPNNPNRVVGGANDYVTRTWGCTIGATTPCSALGDGYSGTYYSNDGGSTWCCTATDPSHLGTLIPGVDHLAGGPYDAGGDPALTFDSGGHVYYAGLGFDRTSAPNTVTVNRGSFDSSGHLTWSAPTLIDPTTSPAVFNDKEWIAADHYASSPYRDRVYVTFTRFIFNPVKGSYVQSPIFFASSSNGGATFTTPKSISANVLYGQGSRPVVAPDGTLYVFWNGSTRLAALDSTYVVKSTDGGATWSTPVSVSKLTDIPGIRNSAFRVNSFPAAAAAPNGDLYATWTTETKANDPKLGGDESCAYWLVSNLSGCESVAVWSKSTDGGAHWTAPARDFTSADRTADGYPVTQPSPSDDCTAAQGCTGLGLNAPSPTGPVEDVFPAIGISPSGRVYVGSYRGDFVSPWQTCAQAPAPPEGRINCTVLGKYINNTRLDYAVADLSTGVANTVSTQPINTRNGFGGGFFGDYTDLSAGSDNVFHAFWTDSNNQQTVNWFYGLQFVPTQINQEDVVTGSGSY